MSAASVLAQPQEYEVSAFVKARAEHYGRAIGKDVKTASKKLESIIRAHLDNMDINEEESIPLPVTENRREVLILRKLGARRFSTSLIADR